MSFLKIPNDLTVTEGSTATFSCQSNRYNDKVTWLKVSQQCYLYNNLFFLIIDKDGIIIENNYHFRIKYNGDLEIQRVLAEDEGFYVCSIGTYDNIKYAQAKLTVNGKKIFKKNFDKNKK